MTSVEITTLKKIKNHNIEEKSPLPFKVSKQMRP